MEYKLSPSILAADVRRLGEEVLLVANEGADFIHIDIMDGMFVHNLSFGIPIISGLRGGVNTFFDVHLMVQEPIRYIRDFAEAGSDGITVHVEACENVEETLEAIHAFGKKAAIAVKPMTDIETIYPYLSKVFMVLVMTVEPGYGGQRIRKDTFQKISKLRAYIEENNLDVMIEVDGGVDLENVEEVLDAGANVIVAGTKIFKGDVRKNMQAFKKILEDRKKKEGESKP